MRNFWTYQVGDLYLSFDDDEPILYSTGMHQATIQFTNQSQMMFEDIANNKKLSVMLGDDGKLYWEFENGAKGSTSRYDIKTNPFNGVKYTDIVIALGQRVCFNSGKRKFTISLKRRYAFEW